MSILTREAQRRFDDYLSRVRESLRSIETVDAEEVTHSVIEHVQEALVGSPHPVSVDALEQVLEQLGPPESWTQPEPTPWWKQTLGRFDSGPGDWRLAYAALGLLLIGLTLFRQIGPIPAFGAYLLSRAAIAIAQERNEPLGGRRWFLYPAPCLFALIAATLLLLGPLYPAWWLVLEPDLIGLEGLDDGIQGRWQTLFRAAVITPVSLGIWWAALGLLMANSHRHFRELFFPLASWLHRRHGKRLAWAGIALALVGITVFFVR